MRSYPSPHVRLQSDVMSTPAALNTFTLAKSLSAEMLREKRCVSEDVCKSDWLSETLEQSHIKSRAQQGRPNQKVCSTGGVIKALCKAQREVKGQIEELITHDVDEELSPNATWKTRAHTHIAERKSRVLCSCWTEFVGSELFCRRALSDSERGRAWAQVKWLPVFVYAVIDMSTQ